MSKKELHLPELQKAKMKCVFCGASNQKVKGGYFKKKFMCITCDNEISNIRHYLGEN